METDVTVCACFVLYHTVLHYDIGTLQHKTLVLQYSTVLYKYIDDVTGIYSYTCIQYTGTI